MLRRPRAAAAVASTLRLRAPAAVALALHRRTISTESATASELYDIVQTRFKDSMQPPTSLLQELASKAATAEEAQLLLSVHRQYVDGQRLIGRAHATGLVDACIRGEDWDSLATVLKESAKLQLFLWSIHDVEKALRGGAVTPG